MYLIVPYSNGPKWWWLASYIIKKMSNGHFSLGLQDFVGIGEIKALAQSFSILFARNFIQIGINYILNTFVSSVINFRECWNLSISQVIIWWITKASEIRWNMHLVSQERDYEICVHWILQEWDESIYFCCRQ